MTRFLQRLLNLQPGDFGRGALLFIYLMLVISSYQIAKSVRDSLFLSVYTPSKISYAISAIAIIVGFVFAAYVTIGRRTNVRNLLMGTCLFFAAGFGVFWYGAHFRPDLGWQFFALYVWVGIYGVLAPAQVWTLANFVLTTREAKRVFGMVAGGAITGFILGGAITSQLAERIGTESLLLVIAAHMLVCSGLAFLIWRKRRESLANNPRLRRQREVAQRVREGLKELRSHADARHSDQFFATLFRLLQEQLGERLDLPASAITEAVIEEKLRGRELSDETLKSLHELFQTCNLARYAPVQSRQELAALIPKLESSLRDLQHLKA